MKLRYKVFNFIIAVLLIAVVVGNAFAWFTSAQSEPIDVSGASVGAYFAYGTGKKGDPYGITTPSHLYNLAWLQNTGRITNENDSTPKYFELGADITIERGYVLPPIGNTANPFNSIFDGNGHTITNLIISTNKKVLYGNPADKNYTFSNAVGMFGMTGADSEITNFILVDPTVEVAENAGGQDTAYDTLTEGTDERAVGLAIGYVANKASSIGVVGGKYAVRRSGYKTFNSIIGNMSADALTNQNVSGGGFGTGGSGNVFGATLDVAQLADRLDKISQNKSSATPSRFFPEIDTQNSVPLPDIGYSLPFTVDTETSTYEGTEAKEGVANNNIGYLMGNQNKISEKQIKFVDTLMKEDGNGTWYLGTDKSGNYTYPDGNNVPRWFYVKDNGWESGNGYFSRLGFAPISQEKYDSLPENIKSLLTVPQYSVIRIQQVYTQYPTVPLKTDGYDRNTWGYHGQISWNGKVYGEGYNKEGYIAGNEGYWIDTGGYLIDDDGFVFKFDSDGNKDYAAAIDNENIVVYEDGRLKYNWADWYFKDAEGNDFNAFGDYHIVETMDSEGNPTYKIADSNNNDVVIYDAWNKPYTAVPCVGKKILSYTYANGIVMPTSGLWFKPAKAGMCRFVMYAENDGDGFDLLKITRTLATPENPFYTESGEDMTVEKVIQQNLPPYVLFYFEFEVKQEEIYNTEYLILVDNNDSTKKGAYFVYMDIGSSAASTDTDTGAVDREKSVTAIDFIYDGVKIKQAADKEPSGIDAGNFIDGETLYIASKVSVYYNDISATLYISFARTKSGSSVTFTVQYNGQAPDNADSDKYTATATQPTFTVP